MRRLPALAAALGALAGLVSGCGISPDEEMRPRTARTVTETQTVVPRRVVPDHVPVPDRPPGIGPQTRTWARGSVLHVAGRQVDVAPLRVDAWVVVPGGVYFLDGQKLWFTDLARVRDTALDDVDRLAATPDGSTVVVRFGGPARPSSYAFDTHSGDPVDPRGLRVVPAHRSGGR